MNLKETLCDNIAKRRKKIGLTQAALADRLAITPEAMTRIEKGTIAPKLSRLDTIANILQCTVSDLLRPYREEKSSRAEIIQDALAGLPDEAQDAIVGIVVQTASLMKSAMPKK